MPVEIGGRPRAHVRERVGNPQIAFGHHKHALIRPHRVVRRTPIDQPRQNRQPDNDRNDFFHDADSIVDHALWRNSGVQDSAPSRQTKNRGKIRGSGCKWSGRRDLNPGPFAPQANALPVCATPRPEACSVVVCITGPAVPSTALFRTRRVDSPPWPRYLSPRLEWRGSQVVRRGSAKSLCIGSIPIRASNFRSESGAARRLLHIKAT